MWAKRQVRANGVGLARTMRAAQAMQAAQAVQAVNRGLRGKPCDMNGSIQMRFER